LVVGNRVPVQHLASEAVAFGDSEYRCIGVAGSTRVKDGEVRTKVGHGM